MHLAASAISIHYAGLVPTTTKVFPALLSPVGKFAEQRGARFSIRAVLHPLLMLSFTADDIMPAFSERSRMGGASRPVENR